MQKQPVHNTLWLIILVILAAVIIVMLKSQKTVVKHKPSNIDIYLQKAKDRNGNAWKFFQADLERIFQKHEPNLKAAATAAAAATATYESCCAIVYYLAWDKVKNDNTTDSYLQSKITPILDPAINALSKDINDALDQFDNKLKRSTLLLAKDLFELENTHKDTHNVSATLESLNNDEMQKTLRNFGINAATISISAAVDLYAIFKTKFAKMLQNKISTIAIKMFKNQVARTGGLSAIAATGSPFIISDIIAIGGLIWTGYDIYKGKKEFEEELNISIQNILNEAKDNLHKQTIEHAELILTNYQNLQYKINSQAAKQLGD